MRALGLRHSITKYFLGQLERDISAAGVSFGNVNGERVRRHKVLAHNTLASSADTSSGLAAPVPAYASHSGNMPRGDRNLAPAQHPLSNSLGSSSWDPNLYSVLTANHIAERATKARREYPTFVPNLAEQTGGAVGQSKMVPSTDSSVSNTIFPFRTAGSAQTRSVNFDVAPGAEPNGYSAHEANEWLTQEELIGLEEENAHNAGSVATSWSLK